MINTRNKAAVKNSQTKKNETTCIPDNSDIGTVSLELAKVPKAASRSPNAMSRLPRPSKDASALRHVAEQGQTAAR